MRRYLMLLAITVSTLIITVCFSACDRTDKKSVVRPQKVTIAYATLPETALAQIAQSLGYYRDEGLEASARAFPYGKLALKELLEGRADFATVAETPVMFAIMQGAKISILATIQSSTKTHAIVARADKGIRSPQDLRGKKIATTLGITADFFMSVFFTTHGIARSDIKIVNLPPHECRDALAEGRVDAVSTFYPFLSQTQKLLGDNGITFYDKDVYTETFHVVATQNFVQKNPEAVNKLLRALVRAEIAVDKNPAEAQKIVSELSGIDLETLRAIWYDMKFAVSLDQSLILALEDESQWAINNKLTKATKVPNYLNSIYLNGLQAVKPDAVRILR